MDGILQGTTPILSIALNTDEIAVDAISALELVFHQTGHAYLIKTLEDCETDSETNTVAYHFTEEETLGFDKRKPLVYQLRIKTADGEILGTEKTEIAVLDLLRKAAMPE